ncbi:hypothetical protein [Paenibacillus xanthanilyticus]|uniref:Uncharacterized protein n=1 Tax=Paenibacillus xanthanilyticus TaxID=1783531 RepID=A0ABV8K7W2_9BACL
MTKSEQIEKVLWSIALPGFGQLLKKHYVTGVILIAAELLINVNAHLNEIIMLSFLGEIEEAVHTANYQWLLFYPCFYMFGIWDAYRIPGSGRGFSFTASVLAAYCATVGVFYSKNRIFGVVWGPVWLPMIGCFVGLAAGLLLQQVLKRWRKS